MGVNLVVYSLKSRGIKGKRKQKLVRFISQEKRVAPEEKLVRALRLLQQERGKKAESTLGGVLTSRLKEEAEGVGKLQELLRQHTSSLIQEALKELTKELHFFLELKLRFRGLELFKEYMETLHGISVLKEMGIELYRVTAGQREEFPAERFLEAKNVAEMKKLLREATNLETPRIALLVLEAEKFVVESCFEPFDTERVFLDRLYYQMFTNPRTKKESVEAFERLDLLTEAVGEWFSTNKRAVYLFARTFPLFVSDLREFARVMRELDENTRAEVMSLILGFKVKKYYGYVKISGEDSVTSGILVSTLDGSLWLVSSYDEREERIVRQYVGEDLED